MSCQPRPRVPDSGETAARPFGFGVAVSGSSAHEEVDQAFCFHERLALQRDQGVQLLAEHEAVARWGNRQKVDLQPGEEPDPAGDAQASPGLGPVAAQCLHDGELGSGLLRPRYNALSIDGAEAVARNQGLSLSNCFHEFSYSCALMSCILMSYILPADGDRSRHRALERAGLGRAYQEGAKNIHCEAKGRA